ncbi:IclR family transcriptional regulator [Gordonia sp. FQ]|uniref:IclR family transcriptional regulator n=1 Tax=Gordonia sp. FQ TaxID=3446634 RepID=UPI003F867C0B
MAGNTAVPGESVIARTMRILYTFDEQHRSLSLTEIACRSGLPAATAHRMLKELVVSGALVRRGNGRYVVGRRMWDVGLLAPQTGLRDIAAPFLSDIHAATKATVMLAIRENDRVLYLERLSGHASVPVVSNVGSRLPLHATGVGKVLLASAPDSVVEHVMSSLTPHTPYTITSPAHLRTQLEEIRKDGYATTVEEMTLGACSVAVPIVSGATQGGGRPPTTAAALGIVVPNLRRHRAQLLAALRVAARGIGRGLL